MTRTDTPVAIDSNDIALNIPNRGELRRTTRWPCSGGASPGLLCCATSSVWAAELVILTPQNCRVFIYTQQLLCERKHVFPTDISQTRRPTSSPSYTSTSSSPPSRHAPRHQTARWRPTPAARGDAGWPCPTRSTPPHGRTSQRWRPIGSRSGSRTHPWPCTTRSTTGAATPTRILGWRSRRKARTRAYRSGASTRTSSALRSPTASADALRTSRPPSVRCPDSCRAITAAKYAFSAFTWSRRQ